MNYTNLFRPLRLGPVEVPHRVFMAPLTRVRSREPGDVPTHLMEEYYQQRAGAGLIISEATQVSFQAKGYSGTPGLHTPPQKAAWRRITDSVHRAGGHMAVQLWHTGRISHASLQPDQRAPVAPSAINSGTRTTLRDRDGEVIRVDTSDPRELTRDEIAEIVGDFGAAAANARDAGFDLAEIHAAHGYLIQQFLSPTSNRRTDDYGGSVENRTRFALEVVDAMAAAWSADRLGIRIFPQGQANGVEHDQSQQEDVIYLVRELDRRGLSYLHISEPDWVGGAPLSPEFRRAIRDNFSGAIVGAGAYTPEKGDRLIGEGLIDAVAFGRDFLATPDLPRRIREGLPLNPRRNETFYANGPEGYTDYPFYEETRDVA